jgi:hypothetical protein
VLMFFEGLYYDRLGGDARRRLASLRHAATYELRSLADRARLRLAMTRGRRAATGA